MEPPISTSLSRRATGFGAASSELTMGSAAASTEMAFASSRAGQLALGSLAPSCGCGCESGGGSGGSRTPGEALPN